MKHYIYIPGLGDRFDPLRRLALRSWRSSRACVTFVPMRWSNKKETYEQKYERVVAAIEHAKGDEIILVGESAGAAMTLLAFSRQADKVSRMITICGYNHGAADVHVAHRRLHPAFYAMMPVVDEISRGFSREMKRRITTIYSTRDRVVTPDHSHIQGAPSIVLKVPGHFFNIARMLVGRRPLSTLK